MSDELVERVVRRVLERIGEGGTSAGARTSPRSAAALPADWPPRTVAIGSDHGGYSMKADLVRWLQARGKHRIVDCGTRSTDSVDYPDYARAVAEQVSSGACEAGIVIDGAGIGSAMAANKVRGVRCAVCHDIATVRNSREHNDANVLSLGAGVVPVHLARRMVSLWLATPCGGGRHLRRVEKIMEIER